MTSQAKTPEETATYPSTIVVDRCFQALPNSDLIDWSILSYVVNLSKGGFVCVSYIADQLGYTREAISRRLASMESKGWINRLALGKRRIQVYLSTNTLNLIRNWKQDRTTAQSVKRCETKQKQLKKQQYNEKISAVFGRKLKQPDEPSTGHQTTTQPETKKDKLIRFIDHFRSFWKNTKLPELYLDDNVQDYLDYCSEKNARPSLAGCRRHIEQCAVSDHYAMKTRPLIKEMKESSLTKIRAITRKNELTTDILDHFNMDMARGGSTTFENVYEAA